MKQSLQRFMRKPISALLLGWAFLFFFGLVFILLPPDVPLVWWEDPLEVNINLNMPQQAALGHEFVITIEIENTDDKAQRLESINIPIKYLEGAYPNYRGIEANQGGIEWDFARFIVGRRSYVYKDVIEPGETIVRQMTFIPKIPGIYNAVFEICITSASICEYFEVETEVTEYPTGFVTRLYARLRSVSPGGDPPDDNRCCA